MPIARYNPWYYEVWMDSINSDNNICILFYLCNTTVLYTICSCHVLILNPNNSEYFKKRVLHIVIIATIMCGGKYSTYFITICCANRSLFLCLCPCTCANKACKIYGPLKSVIIMVLHQDKE